MNLKRSTDNHDEPYYGQKKLPRYPWIGQRPFYGWVIVFVGFVTQLFQGIVNQGFGTYLPYFEKQFGWSRTVMAAPRSVTQVQNSIIGPVGGWMVDKYGPRVVVTIGIFIMGLGLILFGIMNNLFMFYLSNIIIALGTSLQGLLILSVAVNHWFRRKRSLSQSIFLLGFAMAGAVGVPLLVLVEVHSGWQISAIGSGLIIWGVGFPVAQLLRTDPEPYGLLPDGDRTAADITIEKSNTQPTPEPTEEFDFTLSEAIHTTSFWLLAVGWAVGNLGMGAIQIHLFLFLEGDVGLSSGLASLVWSVASISNIPSRLLGGFFGDRVPKNLLVAASMVFMSASVFALSVTTSMRMALVYAVLYGIGWGIRTPVMNALQGDYFGRKSQGLIRGWLNSLSMPLTIAAPPVVGYLRDVTGTYRPSFKVLSLVMILGGVLIALARRPKEPRRHNLEAA